MRYYTPVQLVNISILHLAICWTSLLSGQGHNVWIYGWNRITVIIIGQYRELSTKPYLHLWLIGERYDFSELASHRWTTTQWDATIQKTDWRLASDVICRKPNPNWLPLTLFLVRQDHSQLSSLSLAQHWLAIIFFIKGGQMLAAFPCIQCYGRQQCHSLYLQKHMDTPLNSWIWLFQPHPLLTGV